MSFLKNKHILAAMIVSPILAVITYFAIDYVVKEKPHAAKTGQSYPLIAKSNCRYSSGQCDLENASFKASLKVQDLQGQPALHLDTNFPLEGVVIGIAEQGFDIQNATPQPMTRQNDNTQQWVLPLNSDVDTNSNLAIVMTANGSQYFGETIMAFSKYETIFKKDFRREK